MTRSLGTLLNLLTCLALGGFALAQDCLNHIAIDNQLLQGDGLAGQSACYFSAYGNTSDAYAKATLLANALGLSLRFDNSSKTLVFSQGETTARLKTTSDVRLGLNFHTDVFTVDEVPYHRPVPMGILVGGASWVAVTPIAEAFGADLDYDSNVKTIFIDTAARRAALAQAEAERIAAAQASTEASTGGDELGTPDVGFHSDYTRVALSIPQGTGYGVSVRDTTMVISLPSVSLSPRTFALEGNTAHVKGLRYDLVDGTASLIVETSHPLDANGRGYRVGLLPANDSSGRERLYIDFGPALEGQNVTELQVIPEPRAPDAQTAAMRAPSSGKRRVVLDPGHGGRFGGTRSPDGRILEEAVVLEIAFKVKALLEAQGVEVIMTRTSNTHLAERLGQDLAARAGLATTDRNMFVSIHANAASSSSANGIETFIFGAPLDEATRQAAIRENGGGDLGRIATDQAIAQANAWQGDLLAQEVLTLSRSLASHVQSHLITKTDARDRGVKQAPFQVLRQARIPAILIEVGFLTHPQEGSLLAIESYQQTLAQAIAEGVLNFFDSNGFFAQR